MDKIIRETMTEYTLDEKTYYVLCTIYGDEDAKKDVISDPEDENKICARNVKYDIFDENFNRLAMQLGLRYEMVAADRISEFEEDGHDVFLGEASPISIICGSFLKNKDLDKYRAIWEKPTVDQIAHYQSLLPSPKDRMESIENEGKQFYIYYTGTTYADENEKGKKIERENRVYLDEYFNSFYLNVKKEEAQKMRIKLMNAGLPAIVGPHSPLKTVYAGNGEEMELPNTDTDTVGIWLISEPGARSRYRKLLDKKNTKKNELKVELQ